MRRYTGAIAENQQWLDPYATAIRSSWISPGSMRLTLAGDPRLRNGQANRGWILLGNRVWRAVVVADREVPQMVVQPWAFASQYGATSLRSSAGYAAKR